MVMELIFCSFAFHKQYCRMMVRYFFFFISTWPDYNGSLVCICLKTIQWLQVH